MAREELPAKRDHHTVELVALDHQFHLSFGLYGDGRVGEVFIQAEKTGTAMENAAKDEAILASLALQYGCPLDVIRGALTRDGRRERMSVIGCALDSVAEQVGAPPEDAK